MPPRSREHTGRELAKEIKLVMCAEGQEKKDGNVPKQLGIFTFHAWTVIEMYGHSLYCMATNNVQAL